MEIIVCGFWKKINHIFQQSLVLLCTYLSSVPTSVHATLWTFDLTIAIPSQGSTFIVFLIIFNFFLICEVLTRSVGAGTIDLSERYSQQCGLGALESWEVAVISGWDRKLCNGTTIMYRSIANDGTFDWTKKVVMSINDNDSADFSKLRMQREHKVIVQARILPAGQLGLETQSIVKLGLHNFGHGSSSINTSS